MRLSVAVEAAKTDLGAPYFTSRGRAVLRLHRAVVEVESAPGVGTRMTVLLPAVEGGADEIEAVRTTPARPRAQETILVAEDEESLRNLLKRQLEASGYRVLAAGCGVEALEIEARHPGAIDALVTDVVMPRMGGPELARALEARRPGIPTLFMSGYPLDEPLLDDDRMISKPFRVSDLAAELQRMLTPSVRSAG